jgi:hypothetical protein
VEARRRWSFITNHAQVLLAIARDQDVRVREVAEAAEITERYAYRILSDLQKAGYVRRRRHGRCNEYQLNSDLPLGDPMVDAKPLRDLLDLIAVGEPGDLVATLAPRRRLP